jgi:hypothetical protein
MKKDFFTFDSVEAFLTEATQPPKCTARTPSMRTDSPDWFGSETFDHAERLARYGWPEGLARMEKARAAVQIPQSLESLTPTPIMAEEGDEILVDRYLDGESDHFLAFPQTLTPRHGRIARVLVNVGGTSEISTETYFQRGAAALAVIDALERAGIRCHVEIVQRSTMKSRTPAARCYQFTATLKRPEDPLELDRMAFFLASSAVQRRFSFRLRERTAAPAAWVSGGMGHSRNVPPEEIPEGCIYFPTPDHNISQEQAVALAHEKLSAWTAEK